MPGSPFEVARLRVRNSLHYCRLEQRIAQMEIIMGRALLLWFLGVPIPIIILLALFWH